MTNAAARATELEMKVRELEAEVSRRPTPETVSELVRAYLGQRQPKSLERALTLVLRNVEAYKNSSEFLFHATRVLTTIKDNVQAAKLAVELADRLVELRPHELKSYANAAFVHWRVGDTAAAIEISEQGLQKPLGISGATDELVHLKGNLAYYYAERGLPQNAERARELAQEAYQADPRASRADTLGYVLLRFARNNEDLKQAHASFLEARKKLQDLNEENPLLEAHIKDVVARLERSGGIGVG